MAMYLTNGTLNYNLTKEYILTPEQIAERNNMIPDYPDPNDERFKETLPVFTLENNQLCRDGVSIGKVYNNKTGKVVEITETTETRFKYQDTEEDALINKDNSIVVVEKLTGLRGVAETVAKYNLLDYLFSDGTTGPDLVEGKTPVGICVAPASHFADNKARFMSLRVMTPDSTEGSAVSTGYRVVWQTNDISSSADIQELITYDNIVTINNNGTLKELLSFANSHSAYIPSKDPDEEFGYVYGNEHYTNGVYDAINHPYDPKTPDQLNFLPSPFLSDGISKNDLCFTPNQALSAVNGEDNTSILLQLSNTTYVAANLCHSFTPGTHNGEWYLPAAGELMYAMVQHKAVNDAIAEANTSIPNSGLELSNESTLTSTEIYSTSLGTSILVMNPSLTGETYYKNYYGLCRAFLALPEM